MESGCRYTKKVQRTFSSNGKIRAEHITFCKAKSGENYLWFEAATLVPQYFPGDNNAPWMHVELTDSRGRTLFKRDDAWLVEVPNCGPGGYEFHFHRLPTALSAKVYDVRVSIGGAGGKGCGGRRDRWKDVIGTVAKLVRAGGNCNTRELNANERVICKFAKQNW